MIRSLIKRGLNLLEETSKKINWRSPGGRVLNGVGAALFVGVVIPLSPVLVLLSLKNSGGSGPGTISNAADFGTGLVAVCGLIAAVLCFFFPTLYFVVCGAVGVAVALAKP